MSDQSLDAEQNIALRACAQELAHEFEGTLDYETVELTLVSAYDDLIERGGTRRDLPLKAQRVARLRLTARAHVEGKARAHPPTQDQPRQQLPIVWQRLVNAEGETCDRCDATYGEVRHAVVTLREALRPLSIEPLLEVRTVDDAAFRADPSMSNRIWVNGEAMEDWLGAKVGSSRCCSVCGDAECRTVEVDGNTFEAIPERVLVRAGLIAAAQMLSCA